MNSCFNNFAALYTIVLFATGNNINFWVNTCELYVRFSMFIGVHRLPFLVVLCCDMVDS